jgi:Fur family peroxide stress response transcriptional regulator
MNLSLEDIQHKFRDCGLKSTPQRTAIYQALVQSTTHPTAEDLFAQVSPAYPMLSLNTVYYTLGVLRTAGLVQEVNIGHDRARFDANLTPHHHVICQGCQTILDVMDPRLNRLAAPSELPKDFHITSYQVAFRGYCSTCRKAQKPIITSPSGKRPVSQ